MNHISQQFGDSVMYKSAHFDEASIRHLNSHDLFDTTMNAKFELCFIGAVSKFLFQLLMHLEDFDSA